MRVFVCAWPCLPGAPTGEGEGGGGLWRGRALVPSGERFTAPGTGTGRVVVGVGVGVVMVCAVDVGTLFFSFQSVVARAVEGPHRQQSKALAHPSASMRHGR